jgi:perosamine synthetase
MKVPWAIPYLGKEETNEVMDSLKSGWVTMGPKVRRLENEMASYIGVKHAIAVNSGTAALDTTLKALGIAPEDEVIVPAMTYIATVNAVSYNHATPILADIEPKTFNIDPQKVEEVITPKTKCIIPIDYGGESADYDALIQIAEKHNIYLLEDGAHSIGSAYKGRKLCSFGHIATTSFHAAKLITSAEGGMIFTNDDELAQRCQIIRNQGEDPEMKYHHVLLGHNYRMTDLHAAIGLAQFHRLDGILRKRARDAEYYTENLKGLSPSLQLPYVNPENTRSWFLYPVLLDNRDRVRDYLKEKGVDTRVSWILPVHQQPIYQWLPRKRYPVAERISQTVLNLPMYYIMSREEQDYVTKSLKEALKQQ